MTSLPSSLPPDQKPLCTTCHAMLLSCGEKAQERKRKCERRQQHNIVECRVDGLMSSGSTNSLSHRRIRSFFDVKILLLSVVVSGCVINDKITPFLYCTTCRVMLLPFCGNEIEECGRKREIGGRQQHNIVG